jgi:hypothetical protein
MGIYDGSVSNQGYQAFQIGIFSPNGVGDPPFTQNYGIFLGFWFLDAIANHDSIVTDWHHVVVVWNGASQVDIYINGKRLPGSVVYDGHGDAQTRQPFMLPSRFRVRPDSSAPTYIGMIVQPFWGRGQTHFCGIIDEVAIWERPLSNQEAELLYTYSSQGGSYCEAIRLNSPHSSQK